MVYNSFTFLQIYRLAFRDIQMKLARPSAENTVQQNTNRLFDPVFGAGWVAW